MLLAIEARWNREGESTYSRNVNPASSMTSPVLELNAAVKVVEIAVVLAAIAFMIKEKKKKP